MRNGQTPTLTFLVATLVTVIIEGGGTPLKSKMKKSGISAALAGFLTSCRRGRAHNFFDVEGPTRSVRGVGAAGVGL